MACASIDDYQTGVIKKHENTREDKEIDRIRHVTFVMPRPTNLPVPRKNPEMEEQSKKQSRKRRFLIL